MTRNTARRGASLVIEEVTSVIGISRPDCSVSASFLDATEPNRQTGRPASEFEADLAEVAAGFLVAKCLSDLAQSKAAVDNGMEAGGSMARTMSICSRRLPTIKPCKRACLAISRAVGTSPPVPVRTPISAMCPPMLTAWIDWGSVPGPLISMM
jgi:hypothetical protein